MHRFVKQRLAAVVAATLMLVAVGPASAVIFVEANGVLAGEAELFTSRTDVPGGANWTVVPDEGVGDGITNARGGRYLQNLPDATGGGGGPNNDPTASYSILINTPGEYRLFLRWEGNSNNFGASDSLFADIVELKDGAGGTIPDWYEFQQGLDGNFATSAWDGNGGFEQNQATPSNTPATFDIPAPGLYTLRLSRREDGAAVDSFVLQSTSITDTPDGIGPTPKVVFTDGTVERAALTADADSFVRLGQATNNFGSATQVLAKDSGGGSTTRKGYIRFDVSGINFNHITAAELELEVSTNNNGGSPLDPTPKDYIVNLFGLNDGDAGEGWDESTINFNNAPANAANNGIDTNAATLIGQFTMPALNPSQVDEPIIVGLNDLITPNGDDLINFLKNDTDGLVTFILTRAGDSNNLGFASRENPDLAPPTLRLYGAAPVPEPATLGLLSLAGIAMLRRRSRASDR